MLAAGLSAFHRWVNVLWIVTTQWRAQACGYAGDRNAHTPALDALAARSVNFAQAVTPHPFGPFARAALLTGRESPQNGVVDYFDALPADAETVAHRFARLGHRTAYFGKWHLAPRSRAAPLVGVEHARTRVPDTRRGGFEFWEGFEGGFQLNDPWLQGTRLPEPVQFPGYQSDVVSQRAASWLAGQKDAPWFCVLSLEPPHPPYDACAAHRSGSEDELTLRANVPDDAAIQRKARSELQGYYEQIEATDRAIGQLLHTLDLRRTVVVFTSVHGDMHGSHGLFRKGWPHEESIRVPLLISVPGVAASRRDGAFSLVQLEDVSRRLAAGEALPGPTLEPARISMPSVVALPLQCDRRWTGWRTSERKYVAGAEGAPWLYFDLARDPLEQINRVDDSAYAEEIAAWRNRR